MLLEKLKKDRQAAAKDNKVKRSILTTLLGEVENISKRNGDGIDDTLISNVAKKFVSSNKETLAIKESDVLVEENKILSEFILEQMTVDQIRAVIEKEELSTMKDIMSHLSANYKGLFNGKEANLIAREYI
tara:strand:+ start:671 stop:1063 length:393 start_codon:yes stop_codon:yes gene_type:complete